MSAPSVSVSIAAFIGSSILPCVAYGINSTLFFMTTNILCKRRKAKEGRVKTTVMTTYLFVLFALATAHLVTDAVIEGTFIAQLVDLYLGKEVIPPEPYAAQAVNRATYVIMAFMTDGLLVSGCRILVLVFPADPVYNSSGGVGFYILTAQCSFVGSHM
jgi:hypothetical protein